MSIMSADFTISIASLLDKGILADVLNIFFVRMLSMPTVTES